MRRLLLLAAVTAAVGCAGEPSAVMVHEHTLSAEPESPGSSGSADQHPLAPTDEWAATSTTAAPATTAAPTTTAEVARPAPVRTVPNTTRPATTVAVPAVATPTVHGADFWYRLADCESGVGATSPNIFQFMGGTAEKVGYYAGASYAEQVAMAKDWAARIHPREGTTAGWPVCWWTALRGGS